jgi:uncharacterized protein
METKMPESVEVTIVETARDDSVRTNGLADLAIPDFTASYGLMGGNPLEPSISTPREFITSADYNTFTLNRPGLSYGFKSYGLVRAICRQPVDDAFKGGIEIEIPEIEDPEEHAGLLETMEDSDDLGVVKSVFTWLRLFGGAGLVVVTEQDPSTPLNPKALEGSLLRFLSADRWELLLSGLMAMPGYEQAATELERARMQYGFAGNGDFTYYGIPLHNTRVVKLSGEEAPSLIRPRLQGWGLSVLEQCMREIQTYLMFQDLCYELVKEAKVDVYKIESFNDQLATPQGTADIKFRVALANWIKNFRNAVVMDMKDDYEQKQLAFSGLAEMLVEFRINLCAALRIPYNKLFGQSASGLNASGEDSMENYNSMIEVEVREKAKVLVRKVISLRCLQRWGFVPRFTFKFKPLRELGGVEEEGVKTSKQNRIMQLRSADQITGKEADEILHKEGLLHIETEVGQGLREPEPGAAEAQAQAEAQIGVEKAKGAGAKKKENAKGIEWLRELLKAA